MVQLLSESEGIEGLVFVVTGGAGHVGSALCLELARRGAAEVRSFDVCTALDRLEVLRAHGIRCITGDVRRKEDVEKALRNADCVFHLASFGMSGKEMLQARHVDEVNLDGTCNVLDSCIMCGVGRLIYTSTYNVVFGGQEIRNGTEDLPYFPTESHVDPYGRSKALAEQLVLRSNNRPLKEKRSKKLYTCAIRPAAIYGPGEDRHFPRILTMAKYGLFLFRIGSSKVLTDWVYTDNLVHAQLLASMALLDDIPGRSGLPPAAGQAYFISDGSPINTFEFLRPVVEGLGYSVPQREISVKTAMQISWFMWGMYILLFPLLQKSWIPQPFILPAEVYKVGVTHYCSTWKARQELGYIALVDAKEGMHRTVAYWKELRSQELPSPSLLVRIALVAGIFFLFLCSFVPAPFMGPLECVRSLAFFLFRTQNIMRIGFYMACLAHLVEGGYAWILARKVDPSNATGWWLQTSVFGFPSLRLLLQKARHQRNEKQK
ncbi:hypothetical protein CY35_02G082100 [Sphagnum magellanicum]|nr:hypothetical protein CY35_02G082100 [Sphagnum magellanicum]